MDGIQFFLHGAVQGHCAGIRLVTQKQQQVQQRYLVFVQVGQISQVVVFGGIQGVYGSGQFVIQTGCLRQLTRVQGVGQHIAADDFGVGQPHGVVHLGIGFQGIQLNLGTETFCRDAWRFWEQVQDNPRLLGDFVWSGMDYLGEVGLGAWEYKDYAPDFAHGPGWISSGCGRVDLIGTPLGEALYTRVVFEQQAGPLMAVVPVNHTRDSHSPSAWKMSNALPSWSWQGQDGAPATVELLLNDEPVARRKVSRTLCTVFHITYHPGTLTAVARDAQVRELGRHSLRSAGDETCLCLLPEQPAPRPGGLWFLRLRYTDDQGILKPLERGTVQVTVQGGTLVGLGSACPYHPRGYRTEVTDTYYGEALAVVRAGGTDPVTVTAQDDRHTMVVSVRPEE